MFMKCHQLMVKASRSSDIVYEFKLKWLYPFITVVIHFLEQDINDHDSLLIHFIYL